jgi:hypothetical protein
LLGNDLNEFEELVESLGVVGVFDEDLVRVQMCI